MIPANTSRRRLDETKVLAINNVHPHVHHVKARDLGSFLEAGDVLVVNRSGTLPSSFQGVLERNKAPLEIRLASFRGSSPSDLAHWHAVAFGEGGWRIPTENRPLPPKLKVNDVIHISDALQAVIEDVDSEFNRLLKIKFVGDDLVKNLYATGKPIQYSYLKERLEVWDQQTLFAGPPISVEPPSAAFALTWKQIFQLQSQGVTVAPILHGAGLSSTGSDELDQRLPLAEWFSVSAATVQSIELAKKHNKKIVALGTTVVRALESAVVDSKLMPQSGFTTLKLGAHSQLFVVNALISGLHAPGTSHLELSKAFCSQQIIKSAYDQAESMDYRDHEFGDLSFLSCSAAKSAL